jgi:hypothetical protein
MIVDFAIATAIISVMINTVDAQHVNTNAMHPISSGSSLYRQPLSAPSVFGYQHRRLPISHRPIVGGGANTRSVIPSAQIDPAPEMSVPELSELCRQFLEWGKSSVSKAIRDVCADYLPYSRLSTVEGQTGTWQLTNYRTKIQFRPTASSNDLPTMKAFACPERMVTYINDAESDDYYTNTLDLNPQCIQVPVEYHAVAEGKVEVQAIKVLRQILHNLPNYDEGGLLAKPYVLIMTDESGAVVKHKSPAFQLKHQATLIKFEFTK